MAIKVTFHTPLPSYRVLLNPLFTVSYEAYEVFRLLANRDLKIGKPQGNVKPEV